jgi:phenylpyruvate tautomerase PptA (4-oxalocrotonate tautomerase family)
MPYLRVCSLELPREVKRTLATELTETIVETRHLGVADRDSCTICFLAFAPDDLAIGGKLVANGRVPDVQLEYRDHDLAWKDKRKLARRLTATVARVLALEGDDLARVNVLFCDYNARDFAVAGALFRDGWKPDLGGVLRRMGRLVRRPPRRRAAGPGAPGRTATSA